MSRTFFEETQSYRQAAWMLMIVISSSVFIIGLFLYGIYVQLIVGEPWGDKPLTDPGLIMTSVFTFAIVGFMVWLILSIKIELKVFDTEIQFRFFPFQGWTVLSPNEIKHYEVKKLGFFERGSSGYHGFLSKHKKFIINGRNALKIKTSDGQSFVIGTQSPDQLAWAMKKLMNNTEPGM